MQKVEIFDEENSIILSDFIMGNNWETDFVIFPEEKKIKVTSTPPDGASRNNSVLEYRISVNPIEIYTRTIEKSNEPPLKYLIKDGVVLRSDIIQKDKDSLGKDYFEKGTLEAIKDLEKEVEWYKIPLLGYNYFIPLYILSKHPEIISNEDYRRFLRQSSERIKIGVSKVEEAVKAASQDLKIFNVADFGYGKTIGLFDSESDKKECEDYSKLPKEKQSESKYGKKLAYVEKFKNDLFTENSPKYVGILEYEFRSSDGTLKYIDDLLNIKIAPVKKGENITNTKNTGNGIKWAIVIALSFIALSKGVWAAIGIFILGAIIIGLLLKPKS